MPIVGERKSTQLGRGYLKDPIAEYAAAFKGTAQNILSESCIDLFQEPVKALMYESSNDTLKNFFVENSADPNSMTAEEYADHIEMMEEQYINDRLGVTENAQLSSFNPVIGLTFPIHKNILMNNIFDKGAIPKFVAASPKFTVTMETRELITPEGEKIDMFKNQNAMTAAIDSAAPFKEAEITLPENFTTDVIETLGLGGSRDSLSIETYISAVKVTVATKDGEPVAADAEGVTTADYATEEVWLPVNLKFSPSYSEYERTLMEPVVGGYELVKVDDTTSNLVPVKDTISAAMHENKFLINSIAGKVKAVKVKARIDTSSATVNTASVTWKAKTDIFEIPSAIPFNTTVSPEEVKDIGALYQVNQLSKIMSLLKLVLGNYKDDKIKQSLDASFLTMPASNKLTGAIDFAAREGYMLDDIEWRSKTFMHRLDNYVTKLMWVLNDPNMTVSVIGNPYIIRQIAPTEYTYTSPSNIGPVELDFTRTVVTSDKRVYNFIGSDKMRDTANLMIVLCPRNTDRIVYRIYDYQLYVSNEIRNAANPALPAIHAFERWKFVEYQPVQARITVANPDGLTDSQRPEWKETAGI